MFSIISFILLFISIFFFDDPTMMLRILMVSGLFGIAGELSEIILRLEYLNELKEKELK